MLTMRFVCRYFLALAVVLVTILSLFMFTQSKFNLRLMETYQRKQIVNIITKSGIPTTRMECRFDSCFDIHQCEPQVHGQLKIFVHPNTDFMMKTDKIFGDHSYEYKEMLNALRNSKYTTTNRTEACVFVPALDLLSENNLNLEFAASALNSIEG